jgi:membrane dipeptidase
MRDLAVWQGRFDRWPDRLTRVVRGAQIAEAKRAAASASCSASRTPPSSKPTCGTSTYCMPQVTRCIQLTYNARNLLGDGCTERTNAGLSDFGVAVVERMNELGIAVDLSHCGEATSETGLR